jgi:ribosome-associated protein
MIEPTNDAEDATPGLGQHPLPDEVGRIGERREDDPLNREGNPEPLVLSRTVDAEALSLAREVVGAASDKGATDIVLMDIRKLSIVADYFVICTGDNERQLRAIARAILDTADEHFGADPMHKPASDAEASGWMLIDFGPVIVHVFSPAMRDFYRLERLWSEAATLLQMQ